MNERLINALLSKGFTLASEPTAHWHQWLRADDQFIVANAAYCDPDFINPVTNDPEWCHAGGVGFYVDESRIINEGLYYDDAIAHVESL